MRKIMIVEDDVLIRQELETLLTAHGYVVTVVTDFAQTAAKVRQEQPQLILLDVMLPGENGFALCAQIRTFSQAPIIFVTASDTPSDELNSILLGGCVYHQTLPCSHPAGQDRFSAQAGLSPDPDRKPFLAGRCPPFGKKHAGI